LDYGYIRLFFDRTFLSETSFFLCSPVLWQSWTPFLISSELLLHGWSW
jgi:hypothetical protein